MESIKLNTPLKKEDILNLKIGDKVLITGYIYTGRDLAHKRFIDDMENDKKLPFDLEGNIIYYVGPTPTKEGEIIGSAGPTTSYRMDKYTPKLLEKGLIGMIGKGKRADEVIDACKEYKAVYFGATGGAAALISKKIKSCEIIAYEDLGPEAVRKIYVEDFPVIVINDIKGNDLYEEGKKVWQI